MLISVQGRTREIALRQALGAKKRDIVTQFLIEAITLSIAGGVVGVAFGILASWLIAAGRLATSVGFGAILLALCFCAMVGIGFGFYPARNAASRPHRSAKARVNELTILFARGRHLRNENCSRSSGVMKVTEAVHKKDDTRIVPKGIAASASLINVAFSLPTL